MTAKSRNHRRLRTLRPALVPLAGSAAPKLEGAKPAPAPPVRTPLEITIKLRRPPGSERVLAKELRKIVRGQRRPMARSEFEQAFGASPVDVAAIKRWANAHRFTVTSSHTSRRAVNLRGPDEALAAAFGVDRVEYTLDKVRWRSHVGPVSVPRALAGIIVGVIGFDGRPVARRSALPHRKHQLSVKRSFTALEVARLYDFPPGDGRGQTVGVIALGGGYKRGDLRKYYSALKLRMPHFENVSVCGAHNDPEGPSRDSDGEVTADIETVGALVPAARIVVYFGPNSARGFVDAVAAAVHDTKRAPSVLSISWGRAEVHWAPRTLRMFEEILTEAALLGVTVCCSSGDHGAFADLQDRIPHVCYPGASPYALACGGTSLERRRKDRFRETAWADKFGASGGGVSVLMPLPQWQSQMRVPSNRIGRRGRGVPDVSANGDPATGYRVFVWGKWCVGAGTSAAAPLWAGLIARINQQRGTPVGLIGPYLYRNFHALAHSGAIRPIAANRRGPVHRRWNRHTGLGAPTGVALLKHLAAHN